MEPLELVIEVKAKTDELVASIESAAQKAGSRATKYLSFGPSSPAKAGSTAAAGAAGMDVVVGAIQKMAAPLFIISQAIEGSKLLQNAIKQILIMIQLILKPIGDAVGGIIMGVFKALYPLVRMLNLMWLPHQMKIMEAMKNMKPGGSVGETLGGLSGFVGVVATEMGSFILQIFAVAFGEITKNMVDMAFTSLQIITILVGKLGSLIAQGFDAMTFGAFHLKEGWDRIIGGMVVGLEDMKKTAMAWVGVGVRGLVEAFSGISLAGQGAADSLTMTQGVLLGLMKGLGYESAVVKDVEAGFGAINAAYDAIQKTSGPTQKALEAVLWGAGSLSAMTLVLGKDNLQGAASGATDALAKLEAQLRRMGLLASPSSGFDPMGSSIAFKDTTLGKLLEGAKNINPMDYKTWPQGPAPQYAGGASTAKTELQKAELDFIKTLATQGKTNTISNVFNINAASAGANELAAAIKRIVSGTSNTQVSIR